MIVVGFVSCYREGRLVRGAIDSLLQVELDRLYIYEGPAGPPLENEAELPESDIRVMGLQAEGDFLSRDDETVLTVHHGRWRTDGRKRDDWLQRVKRDYPGEVVWAVVVDADEVLVNGQYLRDRLEWILASDAERGADVRDPANPPMARWPLHLVEQEGSMSIITARVFRVDLLRRILHSSSVVENEAGIRDGWGNYEAHSRAWVERWLAAIDQGKMIAWPPLPCEPHLVHRSNLRHPRRAQLRMSEQEAQEFAKAEAAERAQSAFDLERKP